MPWFSFLLESSPTKPRLILAVRHLAHYNVAATSFLIKSRLQDLIYVPAAGLSFRPVCLVRLAEAASDGLLFDNWMRVFVSCVGRRNLTNG